MVKGISRQVVVVRPRDTKLFEQAIFLIRDGALPRQGVTEDDILREADAAAAGCLEPEPPAAGASFWTAALWSAVGASLTGLAWLLTALF